MGVSILILNLDKISANPSGESNQSSPHALPHHTPECQVLAALPSQDGEV